MDKKINIYDMKLLERIDIGHSEEIIRVPGGWVVSSSRNGYAALTFVPWNNEFQPK